MVIMPNRHAGEFYACILVHGVEASGGAWDWMKASPYRWPIVRTAADTCGLYTLSADMGGSSTWGNGTFLTRMDEAFEYTQSLPQVKKGKVVLIGQSMGGLNMLNWSVANPDKVAAVVGIIPVTNINSAIADGHEATINSAYSGGYSDAAYGHAHNPCVFASELNGIHGQLWVGVTDTIARLDDARIVNGAAPSIEVQPIAGGHAEETLGLIDLGVMAKFIARHSQ